MEMHPQDTGDKITITVSKTALIVIAIILTLGVGLGVGYLTVFGPGTKSGASLVPRSTPLPPQPTAEPGVSSAEVAWLYQQFVCSCCGQDIGSCTCSMAEERRALVDHLVAQGVSKSQVYRAMFQSYGAGVFLDQELAAQVRAELLAELPAERPVLVVEPARMDVGTVPITGGPISVTFTVRNAGQRDLVITGMQTTCGCTTAVLETAQGTSPVFGANLAENPADWSAVLTPGEEASLAINFDPMFHGSDATGSFRRGVSVASNDPLNSRLDVTFDVEVTQ